MLTLPPLQVDIASEGLKLMSIAAAMDEEQRPSWITRQVHDIAAASLAELHSLGHARDRVRAEVCQ